MNPDHDYYQNFTANSSSDVAKKFQQCAEGIKLVQDMESALKSLNLFPSQFQNNQGLIQLETQFLDLIASDNVVHSALYLIPIEHQGKVFIRFIEKGMYKGFTAKIVPLIASKFDVDHNEIYPWIVYTDKDIEEEGKRNKYSERTSTGFHQLMYSNKKSVGKILSGLQDKLDQMNAIIYIEMKNPRPSRPEDRLGNKKYYKLHEKNVSPPTSVGGGTSFFLFWIYL